MPEITTRTNFYLWLLTGRSGDFANPALNNSLRYSVKDTPEIVKKMRSLLRLYDTRTDFYVLGALASAVSNTSLTRQMLHNSDAVFLGGLLQLPASGISSGISVTMLPRDKYSWPSINGARAGADGFTALNFAYASPNEITITNDAGGEETSTYALVPIDGGAYRLSIDKSDEYGVVADFSVDSWGPGSFIQVMVSPSRYPYAQFAKEIAENADAVSILTTEGTMQAFSESSNPATRVGLLALAIIRRMVKMVNEEQAGFLVEIGVSDDLRKTYTIEPAVVSGTGESHVGFDA